MLEQLRVVDYQIHAAFTLTFDPHITTLVGRNGSGKTALLRALRWVLTNTPAGASMIRHGAASASVDLDVDGRTVTRERARSGMNVYKLDGETYHSLKAPSVPDAISRLLNVGPVNFQGQHDPTYWFHETGGSLARELNRIVCLEEIDAGLSLAASDVRERRTAVTIAKEQLKEAENKKQETEWAVAFSDDLEKIERAGLRLSEVTEDIDELENKIDALNKCRDRSRRIEEMCDSFRDIAMVRAQADDVDVRHQTLKHAIDQLDQIKGDLCHLDQEMKETQNELRNKTEGRCPMCGGPANDPSLLQLGTFTSPTDVPSPGWKGTLAGIRYKQDTLKNSDPF